MEKLKKKVFIVIFLILSLCATAIIVGYNLQQYNREYRSAEEKLNVVNRNSHGDFGMDPGQNAPMGMDIEGQMPEPKELGEMRYLDSKVYTVLLNSDNSIRVIVSHSNDDVNDDEISKYANKVIKAETEAQSSTTYATPVIHVGNLYKEKYAYSFINGDSLVILNLTEVNENLKHVLLMCLLLWLAIEVLIVCISLLLTRWIIKPVQESFDRQKEFIGDASHELKTPLTVIMASEEAYEKSGDKKWLDNIKSESEKMSSLVNSLLKLAQTEDGMDSASFERKNLSKLVETSALALEANMFEHKLSLNCELQPEVYLKVDEMRMRELIAILVDNAIEHSKPLDCDVAAANDDDVKLGGEIKLTLEQNDREITLRVINEGDPIPAGDEKKIFERFYRGDGSHNRDSNRYGLGLAIAKNIVEAHNGSIKAYSENGRTTMEVKL